LQSYLAALKSFDKLFEKGRSNLRIVADKRVQKRANVGCISTTIVQPFHDVELFMRIYIVWPPTVVSIAAATFSCRDRVQTASVGPIQKFNLTSQEKLFGFFYAVVQIFNVADRLCEGLHSAEWDDAFLLRL
jgi:hypothetical protein